VVIGVRSSLTDPGPDFTIADAILRLLVVHPTKLNARGGKTFFLATLRGKTLLLTAPARMLGRRA